jgi:hypothetical protein
VPLHRRGGLAVTQLRHAQLNGDRPGVPLRRVIRIARAIVGAIVRGEAATVDDLAQLRWLVLSAPATHLLASSVEHDLGRRRFELWRRIVSNEDEVRAGRPNLASQTGSTPDDCRGL